MAVSAVISWAFWSAPGAGSSPTPSSALTAGAISVPSSAFNSVTVTWTQQASLQPTSVDNSVITYSVQRKLVGGSWAALASGGCSGAKPHGTTSCSDASPAAGSYRYRVVATFRTWTATSSETSSVTVGTDAVAPTNVITLSGVSGGAYKNAGTVFYRGLAAGSFTLTNALTDSGPSGPASSATAALSGTSTGWTHSPSLVSTPAGGPYVSNLFSWSASTTSSPGETVTGRDAGDNTAATALTFTNDSTAPSGGPVDATGLVGTGGRYSTSTTLNIALGTTAADTGGSGVASGAQLRRASATLTGGTCGTYGATTQVGSNDPSSPVSDPGLTDQRCYRYDYVVSDRVGNQATFTSLDVKIDTTAPAAPTFAYSAMTNTYASGSTLYYRRAAGPGAFTVTASATDPTSGILSYAFAAAPAGWSVAFPSLGVKTYSWTTPATAAAGAQTASATNNANLTSSTAPFTLTIDDTAPTGGNVSFTNGYYASNSVGPITFATGGDGAGSGVNPTSGLLQRQENTLSAGSCTGTWTTWATVAGGTNPTSPFADTSVVSGKCYQYQYVVSDRVGNVATYTAPALAAGVDTTPPSLTRSTVGNVGGTEAQHVSPGSNYHIYGELVDSAYNVASATANLSALTTGQTSAAMTAAGGPFSFASTTYSYRTTSTTITANATLSACSYTPTITSTDGLGNSGTVNASKVMVDRDLLTEYNIRVDGAVASLQLGQYSLSNAGDVNDDGRPDAILGVPTADNNARTDSGSAYVVFGQATTTTVDLASALGTKGFRIDGAVAGHLAGYGVADAGDVNADGIDDVLLGAPLTGYNSRSGSGSAYVVFGKTANTTTVDLASLSTQGYRVDGPTANDQSGYSVANAGDVNDDNRPDLIVGAPITDFNGRTDSGSGIVVFGQAGTAGIDTGSLGTKGFRIDAVTAGDQAGISVAGAGDVNKDGFDDVIVGARFANPSTRADAGAAYVVFGKSANQTAVDLASLNTQGYSIAGALTLDVAGYTVANAGDVNGDTILDVIVGAYQADNNGRAGSGSAYVVFGKTVNQTAIDLASLGAQGYRIDGAVAGHSAGIAVAGAGDVNGDSLADVLVGVPLTDYNGRADSGSTYVLFGKASQAGIDLAALGTQGYHVDGAAAGDQAGAWVASAGDVNLDGRPDVLVGSPLADKNSRASSGSVNVLLSPTCS